MKQIAMKVSLLFLLVTTALISTNAQATKTVPDAEKGTWQHLGTATVAYKADKDVIVLKGADEFRKLKFKVKDARIEILDIDVFFENGGHQDISVRSVIEKGGESRVIDLNGETRHIKRIAFVYKTIPNFRFERAEVSLWGEK